MIAGRLTMRAQVMRNAATAKDGWGNPVAPALAAVGGPVACFIYAKTARELVDDSKSALVEDVRGLFALDADLEAGDQLVNVTDRRGVVLYPGPFKVEGPVQHKHSHREANLQRIGLGIG